MSDPKPAWWPTDTAPATTTSKTPKTAVSFSKDPMTGVTTTTWSDGTTTTSGGSGDNSQSPTVVSSSTPKTVVKTERNTFNNATVTYWSDGSITSEVDAKPSTQSQAPTFNAPDKPAVLDYTPTVLTGDQIFGDPKYADLAAQYAANLGITVDEAKTKYAGIPVASGYFDATGNLIMSGQYAPQFLGASTQIAELANTAAPDSFSTWMQNNGYSTPDLAGMSSKIGSLGDLLAQGPDLAAQSDYAAKQTGFADANAYQGRLNDLLNKPGVMNQQQYDLFMRSTDKQVEQMQQQTQQIAEGLGLTSSGRALTALAQLTSQTDNTRLQAQLSYMNYDQANRMTEYQALVNANQAAGGQYANEIYQNRMGALQAYATQFSDAIQQQGQYLNEYSADYNVISQHADIVYKSIMASIGYDQSQLDQMSEKWNMSMAGYKANFDASLQEYNAQLQQYQLYQQQQEAAASRSSSIFGGLLQMVGGVVLMITSGGTAAAPAAGLILSGGATIAKG